jgi:DNA-binding response OmpR family regulator
LNILIVDDDRDLATGLQELFVHSGHSASVVFTGEEALTLCRDQTFDLALVDLKMNGKDGLMTTLETSALMPDARHIIMTGDRIEQILGYLVDDDSEVAVFLPPISMDEVFRQIADGGPQGIVLCLDNAPDFHSKLEQFIQQRGKTTSLVTPAKDTVASILEKQTDILLLKFSQAPLPDVLIMYLALKQRGFVMPTIMVAGYAVDKQTAFQVLNNMPVSGCLFKPFNPAKLLQDLQLLFQE